MEWKGHNFEKVFFFFFFKGGLNYEVKIYLIFWGEEWSYDREIFSVHTVKVMVTKTV